MRWNIDGIIKKLLLFAFFVSPIGAQWMAIRFPGGMLSVFRGAVFLATILAVFCSLIKGQGVLFRNKNKYSVVFMIVWWMYALFTGLWMIEPINWIRNVYCMSVGVVCMVLCINYLENEKDIVEAFVMFQWGIVVQMLIGWYEVFTRNYCFANPDYAISYAQGDYGFPVAMQYNINTFATLMFIGLFVSAICYHFCESTCWRYFYAVCFISEVVLIGLIQCRSVYLACFISILFWGLKYKVWRSAGYMCVISFLSIAGLFYFSTNENLWDKLYSLIEFDFVNYESELVRLNLLLNGFVFLTETYGFGVGAGQIEEWMTNCAVYYHGHITNMHNWWGEILVAFGIPIFIGYCYFYWRLFWDMWNADSKFMAISLGICLTGFTIALVSDSSFVTSEMLWAFWAIVIAYQGMLGEEKMRYIEC